MRSESLLGEGSSGVGREKAAQRWHQSRCRRRTSSHNSNFKTAALTNLA